MAQHEAYLQIDRQVQQTQDQVQNQERVQNLGRDVDVLVIGAGPSGLSAAYYLEQMGMDYCVIERGTLLMTWRRERWDSFTLVTPNWMTRLPGMEDAAPRDNAFMTLEEINCLLTAWVDHFKPQVLEGVTATALRALTEEAREDAAAAAGPYDRPARFEVETTAGLFKAHDVIVATGQYNQPFIPAASQTLPAALTQLHSVAYKNPAQLPAGGVLVVGGGRSGIQIALELRRAGREVWLSLGTQRPIPDAYDNVNGVYWLNRLSGFARADLGVAYQPEELQRLEIIEKLRQNLATCQSEGVTLVGRLTGFEAGALTVRANLVQTLKDAETYLQRFAAEIEAHIARWGLEKPQNSLDLGLPQLNWGGLQESEGLDLEETGITTVIWATGFRPNYQWIQVPVFALDGQLIHDQGKTSADGLYFTGVELNPGFGGPSPYGVGFYSFGEDARRVVDRICEDAGSMFWADSEIEGLD